MLWPLRNHLLAGQSSTVTDCDIACMTMIMICFSMIVDVGNSSHFGNSRHGCDEQTDQDRSA